MPEAKHPIFATSASGAWWGGGFRNKYGSKKKAGFSPILYAHKVGLVASRRRDDLTSLEATALPGSHDGALETAQLQFVQQLKVILSFHLLVFHQILKLYHQLLFLLFLMDFR